MDHSLYFPAVVAAFDFDPFTKEVTMPLTVQSESSRPRTPLKAGYAAQPVRRNLIELGLACGPDATALEAEVQKADAARCQADPAAGVDRDAPAKEAGDVDAGGRAADPAAIAALASDIQRIVRKRDQLAEELAGLDKQRAELQARLMGLLGKASVRSAPIAPAPPALPASEFLPKAAWR